MMDMLRTTLHWRTVKAIMVTLHSFFEYQKTKGWIATNPAEGINVETPRTERGKRQYPPSIASLRDMHDRTSEPLRLIYEIAATVGLREGELRVLRIDCLQLGKATVKVERAFDDKNKEVPPKSSAGYRSIPIGVNLCGRLQAYLDERLGSGTDLLFSKPDGTPFRPGGFLDQMDRLIARENWPKQVGEAREGQLARFTWHALRHYAISLDCGRFGHQGGADVRRPCGYQHDMGSVWLPFP